MPDIFQSPPSQPQNAQQPPLPPAPVSQPTTPTQQTTLPTNPAPASTPHLPSSSTLKTVNEKPFQYSVFGSMFHNPQGISFSNQEANEKILLFLHADFIVNVPWIVGTIILFLLPFVFGIFLPINGVDLLTYLTPQALIILLGFYYLLIFGYAYVSYITWFYNVSIISTMQVLDIEFSNINYKKIDTSTIDEIADVTYAQSGFLQNYFDFGTVRIATQAQNKTITFENIPQPSYVTDLLLDLKREVING